MFSDKEALLQLLTYFLSGTCATIGFGMLYRIRLRRLPLSVLGAGIAVFAWFTFLYYSKNVFVSNMIAAMIGTLYAEIAARISKAPTTIYLIPSVIPLVPGGDLYYTMAGIVGSDFAAFNEHGRQTLIIALGIAVGIVIVTSIFGLLGTHKKQRLTRKAPKL